MLKIHPSRLGEGPEGGYPVPHRQLAHGPSRAGGGSVPPDPRALSASRLSPCGRLSIRGCLSPSVRGTHSALPSLPIHMCLLPSSVAHATTAPHLPTSVADAATARAAAAATAVRSVLNAAADAATARAAAAATAAGAANPEASATAAAAQRLETACSSAQVCDICAHRVEPCLEGGCSRKPFGVSRLELGKGGRVPHLPLDAGRLASGEEWEGSLPCRLARSVSRPGRG